MSRDVSNAFIAACNAQETDEAFIVCVTIDHPDLPAPIYLNNSGQNISRWLDSGDSSGDSSGDGSEVVFLACPFQPTLADDSDDRPPVAKLIIDNIDRGLVAAIREAAAGGVAPVVTLELVKASDPDTVEAAFTDFEMREITYNSLTIEATLSLESLFKEPACGYSFTPTHFPGLFVFFLLMRIGFDYVL